MRVEQVVVEVAVPLEVDQVVAGGGLGQAGPTALARAFELAALRRDCAGCRARRPGKRSRSQSAVEVADPVGAHLEPVGAAGEGGDVGAVRARRLDQRGDQGGASAQNEKPPSVARKEVRGSARLADDLVPGRQRPGRTIPAVSSPRGDGRSDASSGARERAASGRRSSESSRRIRAAAPGAVKPERLGPRSRRLSIRRRRLPRSADLAAAGSLALAPARAPAVARRRPPRDRLEWVAGWGIMAVPGPKASRRSAVRAPASTDGAGAHARFHRPAAGGRLPDGPAALWPGGGAAARRDRRAPGGHLAAPAPRRRPHGGRRDAARRRTCSRRSGASSRPTASPPRRSPSGNGCRSCAPTPARSSRPLADLIRERDEQIRDAPATPGGAGARGAAAARGRGPLAALLRVLGAPSSPR